MKMNTLIPILFFVILSVIFVFVAIFCKSEIEDSRSQHIADSAEESTESAKNASYVELIINGQTIKAEVANTPALRSKGLMFREELAENSGMLFVFPHVAKHSFWMANTKIPLDIIWINSDWEIVDISLNTPPCTETGNLRAVCKTYSPNAPAKYVLELNGGWTEKHGVQIGNVIARTK